MVLLLFSLTSHKVRRGKAEWGDIPAGKTFGKKCLNDFKRVSDIKNRQGVLHFLGSQESG